MISHSPPILPNFACRSQDILNSHSSPFKAREAYFNPQTGGVGPCVLETLVLNLGRTYPSVHFPRPYSLVNKGARNKVRRFRVISAINSRFHVWSHAALSSPTGRDSSDIGGHTYPAYVLYSFQSCLSFLLSHLFHCLIAFSCYSPLTLLMTLFTTCAVSSST